MIKDSAFIVVQSRQHTDAGQFSDTGGRETGQMKGRVAMEVKQGNRWRHVTNKRMQNTD